MAFQGRSVTEFQKSTVCLLQLGAFCLAVGISGTLGGCIVEYCDHPKNDCDNAEGGTISTEGGSGDGDGDGDASGDGDGDGDTGGDGDPIPDCGNNVAESGETCDGSDLNDETCASLGFIRGSLECLSDCSNYDDSGCSNCGNGVIDQGEQCDGMDLNGFSCIDLGYDGGILVCDPINCTFDDSACISLAECGNNVAELGEACDGDDLQGQNCMILDYADGQLQCNNDCSGFDASMCHDGNCCFPHPEPGCESSYVQNCVCGIDSDCCDSGWTDQCVSIAESNCDFQCL